MSKNCSAAQVCDDLLMLLSSFKAQMVKMADEHGLTPMQLHALRVISEGTNTMSVMAQTMHCDASNVTGIVDRLLTLKLVTRKESEHDRRVKTVQLTANGRAILDHVVRDMPTRLGCDRLSQKELNSLHSSVQRLGA